MKKSAITYVALLLLALSIFSVPVLAAVTVESAIDQDISVAIDFRGFSPQTYAQVKANTQFNATSIPQIITENLAKKNLKRVMWGYARIDYNDAENSVHVAFHLGGSDILSFTINRTSMVKTYRVSTEWREFRVELAEGFPVNFAQFFGTPLSEWQRTNRTDALGVHPTYYYEHLGEGFFQMSFYFILPTTAKRYSVTEDTITYEVPPSAGDVFLNSPFLILAAVITISVVIVVYRRVRA